MPGRRAPEPRPPVRLGTSALLLLGLAAALAGSHTLLQDLSWWLAGTLFAAIALAGAALTRRLFRPVWLPPLGGAIASAVALTVVYGDGTGFLLLLPGPETLGRFGELIATAGTSIQEQSVPARPELGIVFLVALLMAVVAIVADMFVLSIERPALAALPLLTVLAVPVGVRAGMSDPVVWIAVVACYLAILRVGARRAPLSSVLAIGAVTVVGSLILPGVLPPVAESATSQTGLSTRVNPFIDLGDDLRRAEDAPALTYSTSTDEAVYLRLATLDDFSGRAWAPNPVAYDDARRVDAFGPPPGLTDTVATLPLTADVQIQRIGGRWLPLPYPVTQVEGLDGDWFWEAAGLTARSSNRGIDGQDYAVDFLDVEPTREQLIDADPAVPPELRDYLELPQQTPGIVAETALDVTRGLPDNYSRAVALQDYFQEFTYSESAPVSQGYDGTGVGVLTEFLDKRTGYCVHFSSAMAVMARELGIPARVVVGFQPGEVLDEESDAENKVFQVTTHDAHAWPELYFTGVGWVRFEPTPSRGDLPSYTLPAAVDDPATPDVDESTTEPSAPPSVAPSAPADAPDRADVGSDGSTGSAGSASQTGLVAAAVTLVVLLLLLAPAVIRRVIRGRRLGRVRRGIRAGDAAWAELRDTAVDHGWYAPPTETVRDLAARLESLPLRDPTVLDRLRASVETNAYARDRGAVSERDLLAVVRALRRSVRPADRLRAAILPPSLVQRWVRAPEPA